MTQVAYGIALPASRAVLARPQEPWWVPAGKTIFADVPNGRYWAAGRLHTDFAGWLLALAATFSGASGRTYQNAGGLLASAALNAPRITFVGGVPYLLYEPAATNGQPYSAIDATHWSSSNASMATGASVGPDGALSMQLVTEAGASTDHDIYELATGITKSANYTISAVLKAGTRRYVALISGSAGFYFGVTVDTQTWTLSTPWTIGAGVSVGAASITQMANNCYRVAVTGKLGTSAGNTYLQIASATSLSAPASYPTSAGGQTWCAGFAQMEQGSVASSYVPTTSTSATRPAESIGGIAAPGDLLLTFDDNSTQTISAAGFATPSNLGRTRIATLAA